VRRLRLWLNPVIADGGHTITHRPDDLFAILSRVDTPTVCNAIEVVEGKRGFNRFTRGTPQHSKPGDVAVGFARTARIAGLAPPTKPADVNRARRMDYFRSMAAGDGPTPTMIEDTDYPDCIAGWWGEVHAAVHKGLGLGGAMTNGVMSDLDVIDDGFPILAGSIGPSHGFAHVVDIGEPVNVLGITVGQDELVHADRHGVVVIHDDVIATLCAAIKTVETSEAIVLGPARAADFNIEKLEAVWAAFEAART
jgi:hypothetical protein